MMHAIDTWPELLELIVSLVVALLAVGAMQAIEGCRWLGRKGLAFGRGALALLACGVAAAGLSPAFGIAWLQLLVLTPLALVLGWVWLAIPRRTSR